MVVTNSITNINTSLYKPLFGKYKCPLWRLLVLILVWSYFPNADGSCGFCDTLGQSNSPEDFFRFSSKGFFFFALTFVIRLTFTMLFYCGSLPFPLSVFHSCSRFLRYRPISFFLNINNLVHYIYIPIDKQSAIRIYQASSKLCLQPCYLVQSLDLYK